MKGLKFVETISITFEKITQEGIITKTAYFNSTLKTVINVHDLKDDIEITSQEIINKMSGWMSEVSEWIIISVNHH